MKLKMKIFFYFILVTVLNSCFLESSIDVALNGQSNGASISPDFASEESPLIPVDISFLTSSEDEVGGEYRHIVTEDKINFTYSFIVKGAGGGQVNDPDSLSGNGGRNSFLFTPGESGVLIIVIGGGGLAGAGPTRGAPGGGASSVVFDPDAIAGLSDAYLLSIAGGGGGSGTDSGSAGHGGGDGGGGDAIGGSGIGQGAPGDGTRGIGISSGENGNSCTGLCQGGKGGLANSVAGGFGKGAGAGGDVTYGGGGGGGYGGGSGARWDEAGSGGAGKVFNVSAPANLSNTTDPPDGLGLGGAGGNLTQLQGEDGSVILSIY
jgi:hypothetical protein